MSTNIFSSATTPQAVATMQRFGGSGFKALAQCWLCMDPERRARLEAAFKPEFDRYREMAAQESNVAAQTLAERAALDVAAQDCRN